MASQEIIRGYHEWVRSEATINIGTRFGITDTAAGYVPLERLREYWSTRIRDFLAEIDYNIPTNDILGGYLRIFATLAYISTADSPQTIYLDDFCNKGYDDTHLPVRDREDVTKFFPDNSRGKAAADEFYTYHFLFSPQQLAEGKRLKLHNTALAESYVLPMQHVRDLSSSQSTRLRLYELSPSSGLQTRHNMLVAKIFLSHELEYTFRNEQRAYSVLDRFDYDEKETSNHFLSCYGSFTQNGIGVILLEYADSGSLLDFFKRGYLPYTHEEMIGLWTSLQDLFHGLAELHNMSSWKTRYSFRGIHQDLKPSNIFVFSKTSGTSFGYQFKIGDFGLSSFSAEESRMSDNKSNHTYGAPELMTWHSNLDHLDKGVTSDVDMWSIGCVLLETIVWSVCGPRGLDEFRSDRQAETKGLAPACDSSFHDGARRLRAVDQMGEKLVLRLRSYDKLAIPLYKWTCNNLLVPFKHGRLQADQALYRLGGLIQDAQKDQHQMAPATPVNSTSSTYPGSKTRGSTGSIQSWEASTAEYPYIVQSPGSGGYPSPPQENGLHRVYKDYGDSAVRNRVNPIPHQSQQNRDSHPLQLPKQTQKSEEIDNSKVHNDNVAESLVHNRDSSAAIPRTPPGRRHQTIQVGSPPFGNLQNALSPSTFGPETDESYAIDAGRSPKSPGLATARRPTSGHSVPQLGVGVRPMDLSENMTKPGSSRNAPKVESKDLGGVTMKELLTRRRRMQYTIPKELTDTTQMLKGRDQVFLVDDSVSMKQHWTDVRDTLDTLISIVKDSDPDGVDLRFTSDPTETYASNRIMPLFASRTATNNVCMMEHALSVLVNNMVPSTASSSRPSTAQRVFKMFRKNTEKTGISLYILTNGIWDDPRRNRDEDSDEPLSMCGVDHVLQTLVKRLQENSQSRSHFTIQFIRFGHDSAGKRRLKYLDNEMESAVGWDIVDRRYFAGAVRPILIGALSRDGDDLSDDSDDNDTK